MDCRLKKPSIVFMTRIINYVAKVTAPCTGDYCYDSYIIFVGFLLVMKYLVIYFACTTCKKAAHTTYEQKKAP